MKVLLVHEEFAPTFRGGGEYVMLETARGLMKQGVEVQVVTTGDPKADQYEGIPTTRFPIHRSTLLLRLAKIAQMANDFDLIHTGFYHACLPAMLAGRRAHKPVVAVVLALFQDVWKETRRWPIGSTYAAWERLLLRQDCAALIFLSEFSRQIGLGLGVDPQKAFVISPGIDAVTDCHSMSKQDLVLFSGKLDSRKGIDDVLAVARMLPHVRFCVMGWGPEEQRIKDQAPSNIEFTPYIRTDLAASFARASIFLMPSKNETFGIALIEAMASGCAIVSSVPLPFEGVRVDAGDRQAMADGVQRLWNDPALRLQMGLRNVELSKQYTWESHTQKLISLYEQVLCGKRDLASV